MGPGEAETETVRPGSAKCYGESKTEQGRSATGPPPRRGGRRTRELRRRWQEAGGRGPGAGDRHAGGAPRPSEESRALLPRRDGGPGGRGNAGTPGDGLSLGMEVSFLPVPRPPKNHQVFPACVPSGELPDGEAGRGQAGRAPEPEPCHVSRTPGRGCRAGGFGREAGPGQAAGLSRRQRGVNATRGDSPRAAPPTDLPAVTGPCPGAAVPTGGAQRGAPEEGRVRGRGGGTPRHRDRRRPHSEGGGEPGARVAAAPGPRRALLSCQGGPRRATERVAGRGMELRQNFYEAPP